MRNSLGMAHHYAWISLATSPSGSVGYHPCVERYYPGVNWLVFLVGHRAFSVVLVASLCSACGGTGGVTTVTQTVPQSSRAQSPTTPPPAAQPVRHVRPWYRRGLRSTGFESPTGNIRCGVQSNDHTQLLCKARNNGNAVDLDWLAPLDTSITATISAGQTLGYGDLWTSNNFACWSEQDETYCRSLYSRHGFKINRDGILDWIWPKAILHLSGGGGSGGAISGGDGYAVMCNDGTMSYSGGIQGACSWHGGEAP
jgi:hypothetical protein